MTKFLIVGLGSIGRRHLRNLIALGEKEIVLVRSHHSTLPEEDLVGFPVESDMGSALQAHQPAAVIVANPTALHLDVAIPAAESGSAILLEKPLSHSMDRVDVLRAALSRTRAKVLMGFQFRFHPCLPRVRQMITQGQLGRVLSARVSFGEYLPAWHPWEDYRQGYAARADLGGGVLLTQCHSLDYLPWLVGRPESVWGIVSKASDLDLDVDDTAEVGVRFADGGVGSLHLDYAQQPASHRLEIHGSRGSLECDLLAGKLKHYDPDLKEWDEWEVPAGWERNEMFLAEMKHFIEVAKGQEQPACTLEDGIRVMQLIEAIRSSNASGRMVKLKS